MTSSIAVSRERLVRWEDPRVAARAAREMPGLEHLQAIFRGELPPPPIMALLDIEAVSAEEGRVVFAVEPAEFHYNPIGMVHGGVAATLCDTAAGCAVQTLLPAGTGYTTVEIKVNFVRPMAVDTGRVTCEGRVIHLGGRVATAEARLTDPEGRLYAHATATCLVLRPEARA